MKRSFHLAGFMIAAPITHSHVAWRHPQSRGDALDLSYYQDIASILERGKFDFLFFADLLAMPRRYGNSMEAALRLGTQGAFGLDPTLVIASVISATERLGLAVTKSTTYYPPYDIARTFATLDHLSKGRMAWNVVTSLTQAEAHNFGQDEMLDHDRRYERAEEFLELCFKLWGSWGEGALIRNRETGVFADPAKVHEVNHVGEYFKVRGPLNVPRSPQGRPVIIQAGSSGRGRDYAARWAETLFEIEPSAERRRAYFADVKARADKLGRDPAKMKILPALLTFVGKSEAEAREKQAFHNDRADPIAGLITLSTHTDHDFSQYSLDDKIGAINAPGSKGLMDTARSASLKGELTLRDIGRWYAQGIMLPQFVGTPTQVADQIEAAFNDEECDGFMISSWHTPGAFEEFVDMVVPVLQQRGLFRKEYAGPTLRDQLGLGPTSLTPAPRRR